MKNCEILIYGFTTDQSEQFNKSLDKNCFFITSDPVKKESLNKEDSNFLHKNIVEMMDSDESFQIYSKVIKHYKKKAKLPYEDIETR